MYNKNNFFLLYGYEGTLCLSSKISANSLMKMLLQKWLSLFLWDCDLKRWGNVNVVLISSLYNLYNSSWNSILTSNKIILLFEILIINYFNKIQQKVISQWIILIKSLPVHDYILNS